MESFGPASVPLRTERRGTVTFSEPVYRPREVSVASSRREPVQRDLNPGNLERTMSRVSIRTIPRIQEPSPPRTPSPMRAYCPADDDIGKRATILEHTSSPCRASSVAPSMQSITARNAKSGARQPTMLTTGFTYSDDDRDGSDTVQCVVEPKPSMEAALCSALSTRRSQSSSRRVPFRATALYDYTARNVDELSFKEGDSISVTDCSDDPWWYGTAAGKGSGSFPSNYVST